MVGFNVVLEEAKRTIRRWNQSLNGNRITCKFE